MSLPLPGLWLWLQLKALLLPLLLLKLLGHQLQAAVRLRHPLAIQWHAQSRRHWSGRLQLRRSRR